MSSQAMLCVQVTFVIVQTRTVLPCMKYKHISQLCTSRPNSQPFAHFQMKIIGMKSELELQCPFACKIINYCPAQHEVASKD